jgi:hypothetical protein
MADNFLQFSMVVPLPTDDAVTWCRESLTALGGYFSAAGARTPHEFPSSLGGVVMQALREEWDHLGFEWSINRPSEKAEHVAELWLHADDVGTPEHLAAFLRTYLINFNPTGALWFSWAFTCSKMRVNEFGGGAVVVTANRVTFLDVQDWATRRANTATKRLATK